MGKCAILNDFVTFCCVLCLFLQIHQVMIIPDLVVSPIFYFLLLGFLHPIWDLVVPSLLSMLQAFV